MVTKPNYDKIQTTDCHASHIPVSLLWANSVFSLTSTVTSHPTDTKNLVRPVMEFQLQKLIMCSQKSSQPRR